MPSEHFIEFSEEQQAEYQKYAEEHWDSNLVRQSYTHWNNLNEEGKKALMADGERITLAIVDAMPAGANSAEIQALIAEWHAYVNRFYDCSLEIFSGLGSMYSENPEFAAFYRGVYPLLPEFLSDAIRIYCEKHSARNQS
jgi:hypothetical protein